MTSCGRDDGIGPDPDVDVFEAALSSPVCAFFESSW